MEWFYAKNDRQIGPVSESSFNELRQSGEITGDTLVWRQDMAEWLPCRVAVGAPPPPLVPNGAPVSGTNCVECGRGFSLEDLVVISGARVCAACKPAFLQKLREGVAFAAGGSVWRDGKNVVFSDAVELPCRCFKCNRETNGSAIRRNLSWHNPALYLLLLLSPIIYIIVALVVRKTAKVRFHVCPDHRRNHLMVVLGAWLLVLIGLGLFFWAIIGSKGELALISVLLWLTAGVVGATKGNYCRPAKIESGVVRLLGAGTEFLDSLPKLPGS